MTMKLLDTDTSSNDASFLDVLSDKYYSKYVLAAKKLGIINGNKNKFMPESNITRQDMAVIVANILKNAKIKINSNKESLLSFKDTNSISEYAQDSMAILVNSGILVGDKNNKLKPKAYISRAEASAIISRLYDILNK